MQNTPYYKNKEAREVLGNISRQKLQQYVDSGKINKYFPPGEKHGVYLKVEVNNLARELDEFWQGPTRKDDPDYARLRLINSS